jgi:TfoX/Sxy family transcriptional regulator of competence genes
LVTDNSPLKVKLLLSNWIHGQINLWTGKDARMAFDESLAQRVRELFTNRLGYEEKKMFGGIGFLLHGNMACGVIREDLIVRVGADNYTDALLKPDVELFDMTGKAMTGWVVVKEPGYRSDSDLNGWVTQGTEYSLSLPAK